jgi:hypothetical protein
MSKETYHAHKRPTTRARRNHAIDPSTVRLRKRRRRRRRNRRRNK